MQQSQLFRSFSTSKKKKKKKESTIMLPFPSFNNRYDENWLDHCDHHYHLREPKSSGSLMKPMEILDGGRSSHQKSERKSYEACKSHREAERRRRQRINAHLSTLRSLLPTAAKVTLAKKN